MSRGGVYVDRQLFATRARSSFHPNAAAQPYPSRARHRQISLQPFHTRHRPHVVVVGRVSEVGQVVDGRKDVKRPDHDGRPAGSSFGALLAVRQRV